MHYFQFNIKDWALHTAHLTPEEEAIYLRLVNYYYDTEQSLAKADIDMILRKCRIINTELAKTILSEFFVDTEEYWVHTRCEREIAFYQGLVETASKAGKASAAKRASNKIVTPVERPLNDCSLFVEQTNTHKPLPKNHKKTIDPPDGVSVSVWEDYLKIRKSKKTPITETALKGLIREATKAKKTLEEALIICCERSWIGFKADWIVESPTGGGGKKDDKSWMFSDAGIEKKAQELGITPYGHDTYQTLKQRCVQKMAERAIL